MSSRMDDLVPLLVPSSSSGSDVGFASGTVQTWNAATGQNTIAVAGATLQDVPILNTGEAIALRAGHVVAMLRFKSSYFILGRVTIPGDPQFAGASVAFDAKGAMATGFSVVTTEQTKVGVSLPWPAWADEAAVFISGNALAVNQSGSLEPLGCRPSYEGVGGTLVYGNHAPAGEYGFVAHFQTQILKRSDYPGDAIDVGLRVRSGGSSWSSHANNAASIHALAVFRSTT